MVVLDRLSPRLQRHFLETPCPTFNAAPWVTGPPLAQRKVALISTAGLHRRGDRPISPGSPDYRLIPADTRSTELVMSHVSTNYDRTGFQMDWNVAFPLDRLRELAESGPSAAWRTITIPLWARSATSMGSRRGRASWPVPWAPRASMPPCWSPSDPPARVPSARSATIWRRLAWPPRRSAWFATTPSASGRRGRSGCRSNLDVPSAHPATPPSSHGWFERLCSCWSGHTGRYWKTSPMTNRPGRPRKFRWHAP